MATLPKEGIENQHPGSRRKKKSALPVPVKKPETATRKALGTLPSPSDATNKNNCRPLRTPGSVKSEKCRGRVLSLVEEQQECGLDFEEDQNALKSILTDVGIKGAAPTPKTGTATSTNSGPGSMMKPMRVTEGQGRPIHTPSQGRNSVYYKGPAVRMSLIETCKLYQKQLKAAKGMEMDSASPELPKPPKSVYVTESPLVKGSQPQSVPRSVYPKFKTPCMLSTRSPALTPGRAKTHAHSEQKMSKPPDSATVSMSGAAFATPITPSATFSRVPQSQSSMTAQRVRRVLITDSTVKTQSPFTQVQGTSKKRLRWADILGSPELQLPSSVTNKSPTGDNAATPANTATSESTSEKPGRQTADLRALTTGQNKKDNSPSGDNSYKRSNSPPATTTTTALAAAVVGGCRVVGVDDDGGESSRVAVSVSHLSWSQPQQRYTSGEGGGRGGTVSCYTTGGGKTGASTYHSDFKSERYANETGAPPELPARSAGTCAAGGHDQSSLLLSREGGTTCNSRHPTATRQGITGDNVRNFDVSASEPVRRVKFDIPQRNGSNRYLTIRQDEGRETAISSAKDQEGVKSELVRGSSVVHAHAGELRSGGNKGNWAEVTVSSGPVDVHAGTSGLAGVVGRDSVTGVVRRDRGDCVPVLSSSVTARLQALEEEERRIQHEMQLLKMAMQKEQQEADSNGNHVSATTTTTAGSAASSSAQTPASRRQTSSTQSAIPLSRNTQVGQSLFCITSGPATVSSNFQSSVSTALPVNNVSSLPVKSTSSLPLKNMSLPMGNDVFLRENMTLGGESANAPSDVFLKKNIAFTDDDNSISSSSSSSSLSDVNSNIMAYSTSCDTSQSGNIMSTSAFGFGTSSTGSLSSEAPMPRNRDDGDGKRIETDGRSVARVGQQGDLSEDPFNLPAADQAKGGVLTDINDNLSYARTISSQLEKSKGMEIVVLTKTTEVLISHGADVEMQFEDSGDKDAPTTDGPYYAPSVNKADHTVAENKFSDIVMPQQAEVKGHAGRDPSVCRGKFTTEPLSVPCIVIHPSSRGNNTEPRITQPVNPPIWTTLFLRSAAVNERSYASMDDPLSQNPFSVKPDPSSPLWPSTLSRGGPREAEWVNQNGGEDHHTRSYLTRGERLPFVTDRATSTDADLMEDVAAAVSHRVSLSPKPPTTTSPSKAKSVFSTRNRSVSPSNKIPTKRSPLKAKLRQGQGERRGVALRDPDIFLEALLEDECALYAGRLQSFFRSMEMSCDRKELPDPVARILTEGDDMHFIPITEELNHKKPLEGSAFSCYTPV